MRRLIILVHGIRTRAEWQGRLRDLIASNPDNIVECAGYEYFDVFRFLSPVLFRKAAVAVVLEKIRAAKTLHHGHHDELVIIAHSFGAYIIGTILQHNPDIKPKRILLCGSVLSARFRWSNLASPPDVIINEVGARDIWPVLAQSVTWGYGATGAFGFQAPGVRDRFHDLGHSAYFREGFAETYWLPWINDGTIIVPKYEQSVRKPAAFYKNIAIVLQIKYVALLAAALLGALLLPALSHRDKSTDLVVAPLVYPNSISEIDGYPKSVVIGNNRVFFAGVFVRLELRHGEASSPHLSVTKFTIDVVSQDVSPRPSDYSVSASNVYPRGPIRAHEFVASIAPAGVRSAFWWGDARRQERTVAPVANLLQCEPPKYIALGNQDPPEIVQGEIHAVENGMYRVSLVFEYFDGTSYRTYRSDDIYLYRHE